MRCIFCLKERDPSLEHVFPAAIGGTLTIDRVCKPCNVERRSTASLDSRPGTIILPPVILRTGRDDGKNS